MKKNKNSNYALTVKGLFCSKLPEYQALELLDALELYMRRINKNGIVFDSGEFTFINVIKR